MPVPATSPRPPASVALMSTTACSTCASDAVPELCDPDDPLPELCDPDDPLPELCDPGVPGAVDAVDVAPWALPRATTVTPVAAAMATIATPLTTAVRNGRRRRDAGVHAYCGGQGGGPKPAPAGGIGVYRQLSSVGGGGGASGVSLCMSPLMMVPRFFHSGDGNEDADQGCEPNGPCLGIRLGWRADALHARRTRRPARTTHVRARMRAR